MTAIETERHLVQVAGALIGHVTGLTQVERQLVQTAGLADPAAVEACRTMILAGDDPLGDALLAIRSPEDRRDVGAVYTPGAIVNAMIAWAANHGTPDRVVDPGAGSGRFVAAAARRFPNATLVACEIDPVASLLLRANATVLDFSNRLIMKVQDYRLLKLPRIAGPTLYLGNPPYVRHHKISQEAKDWFSRTARDFGFRASKLAGLHIHFFLRTREISQPGDFGSFVTSAEWMDVNYGSVLREMLSDGLGGNSLQVFTPGGMPFENTMTTGAITCFAIGNRPSEFTVREISSADQLDDLSAGRKVSWEEVIAQQRWSQIVRPRADRDPDMIELGELFRVHRGTVTGGNRIFVEGAYTGPLPERFLIPTVTRAKDLIDAGAKLNAAKAKLLKRVIDLPASLTGLNAAERKQVEAFKRWATKAGADQSFTARQRRAWWSVGLREAAPILCTYMGRRPPVFVRNIARARFVNIAHGLYPRVPMNAADLDAYAAYLNEAVCVEEGRTYAGGLTKFEPKEIERISVPCLKRIHGFITEAVDTAGNRGGRSASESRLSR